MRTRAIITVCSVALVAIGLASTAAAGTTGDNSYKVTRLVSDKPGFAMHTDPNLVNAWGLVAGPTTPWWVANNGTDTSTLYDGAGTQIPLVVDVKGAPTGTVFNGGAGFRGLAQRRLRTRVVHVLDRERDDPRLEPGVPGPGPSTSTFELADRSGTTRSTRDSPSRRP